MRRDRFMTRRKRAGVTAGWVSFVAIGLGVTCVLPAAGQVETWAERCSREWRLGVSASCERAVEEHPQDLQLRKNLARAFLLMGDNARMLRALKDITVLTPEDPVAHFDYGSTAGTLRRYHLAVEALRRAIRLKPDYVEAHLVVAIALEKLGRVREAVDAKLRAAELGDITAMYELAEAYAAGVVGSPNARESFRWMERAANLGHVGAMDRMAEIYGEGQLGEERDPSKAEHWVSRARSARGQQ